MDQWRTRPVLAPPSPTFPSPAFFYFPLEERWLLSWGRAGAGLPPLCTAPRGGWFTCPTHSSSPSSLALLPLHRAFATARGARAVIAFYLFIYLSPPRPRPEPVRVLCFNNFINSRRTCARHERSPSLLLPFPRPHQSLTRPLGSFQCPPPTPSHPEGPPHLPNPHPIQTLVQKHFGIAERSFLATKQVLGLEIFQEEIAWIIGKELRCGAALGPSDTG